MKTIGIILAVVLVVVAAAWFYVGTITQQAIEQVGSRVLGVPVTVDAVQVSLLKGTIDITNLTIANPEVYTAPALTTVGHIAVAVDWKSLLSNTVVLRRVAVENPEFFIEGGIPDNNIQTLQNHLNKSSNLTEKSVENAEINTGKPTPKAAASAKKLRINTVEITGGAVHLNVTKPVALANVQVAIPNTHLTNVGGDNGATAAQVTRQVLLPVMNSVQQAGQQALQQGVKNLQNLIKQPEGLEKNIKKLFNF